ncbi:GNAT family N-acetyltransferase [Inquilinus limosus]|uniref:GNAT family N-acetyltransferase n=1 Tax=Inquilinus limosus TaxID=171674 RepID=UPI003F18ABD2
MTLSIRSYRPGDLDALIAIFLGAIREVASKDYDADQIAAWAQANRDAWAARRSSRPTWVAEIDRTPVGFTDLEPDGHLDMMFVHPAHQGKGVATALLATAEVAAREQGLSRIFTEASITARAFFEAHGFQIVTPQLVEIRGSRLVNYWMEKVLR